MNPPPSPPAPSTESRAETIAAIGDIWDLFDHEALSRVRPFFAPLPDPCDDPPTKRRTLKNDEDDRSNKVEGCPSPQKQRRYTCRTSLPVDSPAAEPPAHPAAAVDTP